MSVATKKVAPTKERIISKLQELAAQAQRNIYELLHYTVKLIDETDFSDEFGGEAQAMDEIESRYFTHLGGRPPLGSMIAAYRKFPNQEMWRRYRYNIIAMIELANPREKSSDEPRINWKRKYEESLSEIKRLNSVVDDLSKINADLRNKVESLIAEAGTLRGKVEILQESVKHR